MRIAVSCLACSITIALAVPAFAQGIAAPALAAPDVAQKVPAPPPGPLEQAQELVQKGSLDRAASEVDAYLARYPKDARARFLKGVILSGQHKADEAISVFTELTNDFPELPEPYNNLGVLYAARGEYGKAREALERAIQARPSFATAHENLGDIYAQLAAQSYAKSLQLDGNNRSAQRKLALVKQLVSTAPANGGTVGSTPGSSGTSAASR